MKISRTSWHYKFINRMDLTDAHIAFKCYPEPISSCEYAGFFLLACWYGALIVVMATLALLIVGACVVGTFSLLAMPFGYVVPIHESILGVTAGVWVSALIIGGGHMVSKLLRMLTGRPRQVSKTVGILQPLKLWWNKVCVKVELVD